MKRRILSSLMALVLVFGLLPATAFAEGEAPDMEPEVTAVGAPSAEEGETQLAAPKVKIGDTKYDTLKAAVAAAASGDIIMLGKGNYTLYDKKSKGQDSAQYTKNKDLTFVGQGTDETKWGIGAEVPDPANFGTEFNGDYCFNGAGTITFQNMTLQSGSVDYLGFIRADKTVVEGCVINGKTFYWGYKSAMFKNTTFNCPSGDYALWTYCSPVMTFDSCTFNSSGKVINVYNENSAADYTINFNNCTVNSSNPNSLSVMNINDKLVEGFTINFTGTNKVTGIKADGIQSTDGSHASPANVIGTKTSEQVTCSKLFEFNMKWGNGNNRKTIVNIGGKTVWKDGKMVSHAIDTANDKYTDGYKDNAFTVDKGAWTTNPDGTKTRTITKTCDYCGYQEKTTQNAEADPIDWDVSKSKTATQLNTNTWTSDVTLSLPSAQENLASDVVFVLDKSQCRNASATAAQKLVSQLLAQQELEKATLKVGVVAFGGTAIVVRDLEKITNAKDLEDAVGNKNVSGLHGTNIQAGLIEADKMLSEDTEVSDNRKYVVLISDGHTYEFSKEGEYGDYVDGEAKFNGLKTYGIYSENDLYAYGKGYYGISYTIHSLHDQYYTGDYDKESGKRKDGWSGSYLTDSQYKTGKLGDSDEVGNVYEMPYGTWDKYLKHISEVVKADDGKYDVQLTYDGSDYGNQCIGNLLPDKNERAALANEILAKSNPDKKPDEDGNYYVKCGLDAGGNDNQLMHASGVDRAVYEAYTKYASMAEKYHCYPIYVNRAGVYDRAMTTQDYGYQLMHALGAISNNTGTDVSVPNAPVAENIDNEKFNGIFNGIKNDILYAVGAGSTVTDTIGKKFDFVGIKGLTVGGKQLTMVNDDKDKNTWYFGNDKTVSAADCRFKVVYDSAKDEFVWTINENVSNFAPVQLTYTVKLTTHETEPGTYGVEDLKGEKTLSGAEAEKALFTNESAVLKAKNSAGVPVEKQEFPKPSVSYTISSGIGGDDGDDDDYFFAIQKVDAQDGHALNGAKFKLYQLDKNDRIVNRRVVETRQQSSKNGIALFGVDNKNSYDGIWYYAEVTAPEGYVLDRTEHKIKATDFSDSLSTAVKYADTVRNYRGTTPDLLNDSDHFAYVIGYMDGNVRPYGLISRAETTTIFFRLLKDSVRDGNLLTSNTYTDVADDYWANTAISTMTGLGIVQGRSTTTFDPKAPITRAQFAAICARFDTGKSNGEQTFSDIQGHWAEKYIERAAELGWIKGFEDGTFRPDTYITRAQAMTMINRVLNRIPEDESDLLPGMNVWPDCNPGDWFYLAIQEATNSHDYRHKAGSYETWTGLNADPDWTRYEN